MDDNLEKPRSDEDDVRAPDGSFRIDQTVFAVNQFGETVSHPASSDPTTPDSKPADSAPELPASIGRYQVRGVLGRGAFGAVFLGYDTQLDRQVAIKVPLLLADEGLNPEIEEAFLLEARQLAQLTHPNIVTVYDVGVDDGVCYIVSDYLEGQSLNHWIHDHPPSWQDTVRIVAAVADALATAHAGGIIHRDVKPANIIVVQRAEGWVPVLVDFGLALSESSATQAGAERGMISGTPNYMSPEQARGEGHRIDGRTDIYALGVILYRMLSGRLPFQSDRLSALLQQVIKDEPRPPRQFVHSIPRELERICLKAMAKQIAERYTTAGDLADELRAFLKRHEAEAEAALAAAKAKEKPKPGGGVKILIAEDHELTRFKLQTDLEKWGHEVVAAEDGEQAWALFQNCEFSVVITDWMMPNVDGLTLVQRIRGSDPADYVYIIMLTAKTEKHDIVAGMGAGADDVLAKPFHRDELHVRLRTGMEIIKLTRELKDVNNRMRRSSEIAPRVQRACLPTAIPKTAGFNVAWEYRPCDELGGDMLNVVPLDDKNVGLYVLDVSGQGIPAALLTTALSRVMATALDAASVLVERNDDLSEYRILEPAEVATTLSQRFAWIRETGQFFTLVYGVLNLESREFRYTNASHPPILHQRTGAAPTTLEVSGFPIGLDSESDGYDQQSIVLEPGDRLLIYSDGLTDTENENGELFGYRLIESFSKHNQLPLGEMVRSLMRDLDVWRGVADAGDDVTIIAFAVA